MSGVDDLFAELDERKIAQEVGLRHDEHRLQYKPTRNTVDSFPEFESVVAEFYRSHFERCCCHNGALIRIEAVGRAKEAIEQELRRRGGTIINAFNDARDGTNNGLRGIFDLLSEHDRTQSTERYIRDALDRYIPPTDWVAKVEAVRELIARFGPVLGTSIDPSNPERYAHDSHELCRAISLSMRQTSAVARRL